MDPIDPLSHQFNNISISDTPGTTMVATDKPVYRGTGLVLKLNLTHLNIPPTYPIKVSKDMEKHKQQVDQILESHSGARYDTSFPDVIYRDNDKKIKARLVCTRGHKFSERKSAMANGKWCKECLRADNGGKTTSKITIERAREYAQQRGGQCLSTECNKGADQLTWKCSQGHIWEAKFDCIYKASWCTQCVLDSTRYTQSHVEQIIKSKGGTLLSPYLNNHTKIDIHCHTCGNVFDTRFQTIRDGNWCRFCSGCAKLTLEQCQEYALRRVGKLLSTEYINSLTPMIWKCGVESHPPWPAMASSVLRRESWCAHCAGCARLTIEHCQEVARQRGGTVISTVYHNNNTEVEWKCHVKEHTSWRATPGNVMYNGTWCPFCQISKGEREISDILTKHGFTFEQQKGFPFSQRRKYDFFILSHNTLIEYDGKQHFIVTGHYTGSSEHLDYSHRVDSFKTNIARLNGYNVIRIDYTMRDKIEQWLIGLLGHINILSARSWLVFSNSGFKTPPPELFPKEIPRNPMYNWLDKTIIENPKYLIDEQDDVENYESEEEYLWEHDNNDDC